ncbi:3500_t:CDS:2 [Paraglomus occultum]|uniref:3500_t:CDS:1 n=1 Tax=Paraglomus occultum TaxID=144539 RepID=A0A9N9CQ46_9GLOM|nr:3500_t:CDS:2 [Paraglomus occultum]
MSLSLKKKWMGIPSVGGSRNPLRLHVMISVVCVFSCASDRMLVIQCGIYGMDGIVVDEHVGSEVRFTAMFFEVIGWFSSRHLVVEILINNGSTVRDVMLH